MEKKTFITKLKENKGKYIKRAIIIAGVIVGVIFIGKSYSERELGEDYESDLYEVGNDDSTSEESTEE